MTGKPKAQKTNPSETSQAFAALAEAFAKKINASKTHDPLLTWTRAAGDIRDFAKKISMTPAPYLKEALTAANRYFLSHELAALVFLHCDLTTAQIKVATTWACETLNKNRSYGKLYLAIESFAPSTCSLPCISQLGDPEMRAWARLQCSAPMETRNALFDSGLGLAKADSAQWAKIIRGIDVSKHSGSRAREILIQWMKLDKLARPLADDMGKNGFFQTLARRAADPEFIAEMIRCAHKEGFPKSADFEGPHPLWTMAQLGWDVSKSMQKAKTLFGQAMDLGFGPNMELPGDMKLCLTATQAKNSAPTIALEWAKRFDNGIADVAGEGATRGMDLDARDAKGETVLGILNRLAGKAKTPSAKIQCEADFFTVAGMGADPFGIAPVKPLANIAANDDIKAKIASAAERKAILDSLEQGVFERAKEIMAQAQAAKRIGQPTKSNRL